MSSVTPNLSLYLPDPGDGTSNGQPWGPQVNANFTTLDGVAMKSDLASTASAALGDALVGVKSHITGATATTQDARNEYLYFANEFTGVDPTGSADSAQALVAFFAAVPAESTVIFNPGTTYKILSAVAIQKNLTIVAHGATFNIAGNNAGFALSGTIDRFSVLGGTYVGDAVDRSADSSKVLIAWKVGDVAGSVISNVIVEYVQIEDCGVGILFGQSNDAHTPAYDCKVINSHIKHSVGTLGGTGYGVQFSQAWGGQVVNCTFDGCERHGLYFAEGRDYSAINCHFKNHRTTVTPVGTLRGSISASRSRNLTVSNCTFDGNQDGCIAIDADGLGLAPNNVSFNNVISGCTFADSIGPDIVIGSEGPGTGTPAETPPQNVVVTGCSFTKKTGDSSAMIFVNCGYNIQIVDNVLDGLGGAVAARGLTILAKEGATYTDHLTISNNRIYSPAYTFEVDDTLSAAGATSTVVIENNDTFSGYGVEVLFLGGADVQENPNFKYRNKNNYWSKTWTTVGAAQTIPVGGVTAILMSPVSAATVTTFSGASDGQELMLFFKNGNTTILNGSIYLAGAANFVGTANDILSLKYVDGAWREVYRSVN